MGGQVFSYCFVCLYVCWYNGELLAHSLLIFLERNINSTGPQVVHYLQTGSRRFFNDFQTCDMNQWSFQHFIGNLRGAGRLKNSSATCSATRSPCRVTFSHHPKQGGFPPAQNHMKATLLFSSPQCKAPFFDIFYGHGPAGINSANCCSNQLMMIPPPRNSGVVICKAVEEPRVWCGSWAGGLGILAPLR